MENTKKVVLDTNFIIDLFRFRLKFDDVEDVVSGPCKFLMVEQSVRELKGLENKYAKVALSIVESGKIGVVKASGRTADDSIVSFVSVESKNDLFVATNDKKLRKRILETGVRVVHLRARKHLAILG